MSCAHLLCIPTLLCGVQKAAGPPTAAQQGPLHTQHWGHICSHWRGKRGVKSTAWGDFHKKCNVICNTVRFQSVPSFSKVILEFSGAAPEHQFTLWHERQALCSLPEHQSHKHLENSQWSLLSSLDRCLLKCQTSAEDVHTFVWHVQLVFLSASPQHSWPVLEPIVTEHSIPIHNSQIGRAADFLFRYQSKFARAHKKKSRQINAETHYQRLLLSLGILQSMPPREDQQGW